MSELNRIFGTADNITLTENGDMAFKNLSNHLLDILFKSEYLRHHLNEVEIGSSDKEKLFAMFIRDARYGLGQREVGRELLKQAKSDFSDVLTAGRGDDLWAMYGTDEEKFNAVCDYVHSEIVNKGELCELLKKWCPRFPTKNKTKGDDGTYSKTGKLTEAQEKKAVLARRIANRWKLNKQQYSKFIKTETVEHQLSDHREDDIVFSHVPSLASIKYAPTFSRNPMTKDRYTQYLNDVRNGDAKVNMAVTTVYDIYRNRTKDGFDADLWYDKLPKISGSFLPIIDVSGSMFNRYDAIGKALSVGYYLSDCSTYCNRQFVTFSQRPQLVELAPKSSGFIRTLEQIKEADWGGNTDLGAVFDLLHNMQSYPDYIVVLTDMQFDQGSYRSKISLQELWRKNKSINTKIIWWNFATSNACAPETDEMGNIYMSGYSPILLQYLESGFNGEQFLDKLLAVYAEKVGKKLPEAEK